MPLRAQGGLPFVVPVWLGLGDASAVRVRRERFTGHVFIPDQAGVIMLLLGAVQSRVHALSPLYM